MLAYQVVDKMKSQSSFEFLTMVSIILIFVLLIFSLVASTQFHAQGEELQRSVKNICSNIGDKINKAIYFGNGFSQNVSLRENIFGTDYTLIIRDNKTLVCSAEKFSIMEIFVENEITNTTHEPPFSIPKREIEIKNSDGVVMII